MSRLCRQCGILDIKQPYRPPQPVTGIALLIFHPGLNPKEMLVGGGGVRLTSNYWRGQEKVDLYIHSNIRLYGVVFNQSSTGTTLPFYLQQLHTVYCYCNSLRDNFTGT
jgi:hypothetical protein